MSVILWFLTLLGMLDGIAAVVIGMLVLGLLLYFAHKI